MLLGQLKKGKKTSWQKGTEGRRKRTFFRLFKGKKKQATGREKKDLMKPCGNSPRTEVEPVIAQPPISVRPTPFPIRPTVCLRYMVSPCMNVILPWALLAWYMFLNNELAWCWARKREAFGCRFVHETSKHEVFHLSFTFCILKLCMVSCFAEGWHSECAFAWGWKCLVSFQVYMLAHMI